MCARYLLGNWNFIEQRRYFSKSLIAATCHTVFSCHNLNRMQTYLRRSKSKVTILFKWIYACIHSLRIKTKWRKMVPSKPLGWGGGMGWICCWLSFLFRGFFSRFSSFNPSTETTSSSIWHAWTPLKRAPKVWLINLALLWKILLRRRAVRFPYFSEGQLSVRENCLLLLFASLVFVWFTRFSISKKNKGLLVVYKVYLKWIFWLRGKRPTTHATEDQKKVHLLHWRTYIS